MSFTQIRVALRHPEFIRQYLTREKILARLESQSKVVVRKYLVESRDACAEIRARAALSPGLGQMDPRKYEVLYTLVRLHKPTVAVETGVSAGVSSAVILAGLEMNGSGELISIDANLRKFDNIEFPLDKDVGFIIPERLRKKWQLRIGKSEHVLPDLLKGLKMDFFLHDSEHTYDNMTFEYRVAWNQLSPGGVLISDNIDWNQAFSDFISVTPGRAAKLYSLGVIVKPKVLPSG